MARRIENLELDISELRPLPKRYYRYRGSLTTPPCSEGVQWIVMAEKRQNSAEQMALIAPLMHDNNRPVQAPNDRELLLISAELSEIMSLSGRILVMFEGRIVAEVPRAEADEALLGLYMAGHEPEERHRPAGAAVRVSGAQNGDAQ